MKLPVVLDIRELCITLRHAGVSVRVVDGVSLCVPRAKTVALVGESGCGKSLTALSLLGLLPQPAACAESGCITLRRTAQAEPVELLSLSERQLQRVRGADIAMVFQEPMTSLNPVMTIGEQLMEAVVLHQHLGRRDARGLAADMLRRVGMADATSRLRSYPHELSGGMRQRVMVAMALVCKPAVLVADEPTTALDVTVQRQLLELLRDLQTEMGLSILFITHDLGVVAEIADHVYVMYAGRIVEHAPVDRLFADPIHPYTQGLLRSCTTPSLQDTRRFQAIPGTLPAPVHWPIGCRFHPRCALACAHATPQRCCTTLHNARPPRRVLRRCVELYDDEPSGVPPLVEKESSHFVACWEA